MLTILNQNPSIANHLLAELRDVAIQKNRERFRNNVERLGELMAYEISKHLEFQTIQVKTPLGSSRIDVLKSKPVLITVLRAGLPYFNGFQKYFNDSDCGFIGAFREESKDELSINLDYLAAPALENRTVIIIDPMLATGKSFVKTIHTLKRNHGNPSVIYLAALVAAPEGIKHIEEAVTTPHHIWTWALDEKLNDHHYIVPGLGDAGDLCFGDKI
jgi:uracil phosphoribosyltransferase